MSTRAAVEREIVEVHEFFEQHYLGTDRGLGRIESVFADDMTFVGPDATESDRSTVIEMVRAGFAHTDSLKIGIEDVRVLVESDELVLARYVESHELASRTNRRLSTVVFRRDESAPNGLLWVSVHETWLDRGQ